MSGRFFGHLLEHMEKRREVRHKKEELELSSSLKEPDVDTKNGPCALLKKHAS